MRDERRKEDRCKQDQTNLPGQYNAYTCTCSKMYRTSLPNLTGRVESGDNTTLYMYMYMYILHVNVLHAHHPPVPGLGLGLGLAAGLRGLVLTSPPTWCFTAGLDSGRTPGLGACLRSEGFSGFLGPSSLRSGREEDFNVK